MIHKHKIKDTETSNPFLIRYYIPLISAPPLPSNHYLQQTTAYQHESRMPFFSRQSSFPQGSIQFSLHTTKSRITNVYYISTSSLLKNSQHPHQIKHGTNVTQDQGLTKTLRRTPKPSTAEHINVSLTHTSRLQNTTTVRPAVLRGSYKTSLRT